MNLENLFLYSVVDKVEWFKILNNLDFKYQLSRKDYYHIFTQENHIFRITFIIDYNKLTITDQSKALSQDEKVLYRGYLPLTSEHLSILLKSFLGLKSLSPKDIKI